MQLKLICHLSVIVVDFSILPGLLIAKANHQDDIDKVELICEAAGLGIRPVPDPYYGGDEGFQNVFNLIKLACHRIAEQWKESHE